MISWKKRAWALFGAKDLGWIPIHDYEFIGSQQALVERARNENGSTCLIMVMGNEVHVIRGGLYVCYSANQA